MKSNPLLKIKDLGQSIWLDYIQRGMLDNGDIARMIEYDGLAGITSNPAIFEKAIVEHHDYDRAIAALAQRDMNTAETYEALALEDVGRAADLFRPLHERSGGADGFVSIEVSPYLAHDTERTIKQGRRLWEQLQRPNIMIKVPATVEGLPAIRRLLADGINVNVTLLFGLERYRQVVEAFLSGLEERVSAGRPPNAIASVASFFLSRIDVLVDEKLGAPGIDRAAQSLRGQAAIAYARLAYRIYKEWTASERWRRLAAGGARPQRLLWASTSTKDPAFSDVKYIDALIGPETVNTVPPETLDAYRDHGQPAARLEQDMAQAIELPPILARAGIDLEDVARQLETEGVQKFIAPFDKLFATLEQRRQQIRAEKT
ncbi:MAG: transaldolase [Sulfuricaulis sp.]